MHPANRVALNTGITYARMVITVGISLYSTRLVLSALGAEDYGIYNLVAGIIAMLGFMNTAMSVSTQRFLSFHQGSGNRHMQRKVFANSMLLHIVLGAAVVAGLEIAGFFLFDGFLNIPAARIPAARAIYHFMSATVFFAVVSVPFSALLIAHENMLWGALVYTIEMVLRLLIALSLFRVAGDKLVYYGWSVALVGVVSLAMYAVVCLRKYREVSLRLRRLADRSVIRELSSFAGWNMFGVGCYFGRVQGLAVVLNLFFGAVVNAAYAVSNQVSAQMAFFAATISRTVAPQIVKSEGAGDRGRMLRISLMGCKFGFLLMAFIAIPSIFEMPAVLNVWLREVPADAVVFCSLSLLGIMFSQMTGTLLTASQAVGKIKVYEIVTGSLLLSNVAFAYILFKSGFPAYYALICYVFVELAAGVARLFVVRRSTGLPIREFLSKVLVRILPATVVSVGVCWAMTAFFSFGWRFLATYAVSITLFAATAYFTALSKEEKTLLHNFVGKLRGKLSHVI